MSTRPLPTSPRDLLVLLLALVCALAPLAFGGIVRSADLALHLAAGVAALLAARVVQRREPGSRSPITAPLAIAIAAVALPHALSALLAPSPLAPASLPADPAQALDEARLWAPTLRATLAWLRFALLLVVASIAGRRRHHRRVLAAGIVLGAILQIGYGLPRWLSGSGEIWGLEVLGEPGRLRGCFVNPDHLALLLEIALALMFAATWAIGRASRFESLERRIVWLVTPLLLWTTLFVAVAFTGSRAGLLAALAATLVQGFAIGRGRLLHRLSRAAVLALGLGAVAWLGLRQALGRMLATNAYEVSWNARFEAARAALGLWAEAPLIGIGIGGFRELFPVVQPPTLGARWRHVHDDWLELALMVGVLGLVVLAIGVVATVARLVGAGLPERSEDRASLVAALGVLVALGVHEALDFGLTMPATGWVAAVAIGGGLSAIGRPGRAAKAEE